MTNKLTIGLSAICIVFSASANAASAQSGANVGVLSCTVEGGIGLILGSSKEMICNFDPVDGSEFSSLHRKCWEAGSGHRRDQRKLHQLAGDCFR